MNIRETSPEEREEIENYLFLDEDNLYSLLPQYDSEYKGAYFSPEGQRAAGKKLFQSLQEQLNEKLCKEWDMCKKISDPIFEDSMKLVIVIGDVIATTVIMLPPILIATILVKIGVRKFCHCSEKK